MKVFMRFCAHLERNSLNISNKLWGGGEIEYILCSIHFLVRSAALDIIKQNAVEARKLIRYAYYAILQFLY
jgi:hypothetical protein